MEGGRDPPKGGPIRSATRTGIVRMRGRCHAGRARIIRTRDQRDADRARPPPEVRASVSRARVVRMSRGTSRLRPTCVE
eukprot:2615174-Alexandrium_andersonii.AAC.1